MFRYFLRHCRLWAIPHGWFLGSRRFLLRKNRSWSRLNSRLRDWNVFRNGYYWCYIRFRFFGGSEEDQSNAGYASCSHPRPKRKVAPTWSAQTIVLYSEVNFENVNILSGLMYKFLINHLSLSFIKVSNRFLAELSMVEAERLDMPVCCEISFRLMFSCNLIRISFCSVGGRCWMACSIF